MTDKDSQCGILSAGIRLEIEGQENDVVIAIIEEKIKYSKAKLSSILLNSESRTSEKVDSSEDLIDKIARLKQILELLKREKEEDVLADVDYYEEHWDRGISVKGNDISETKKLESLSLEDKESENMGENDSEEKNYTNKISIYKGKFQLKPGYLQCCINCETSKDNYINFTLKDSYSKINYMLEYIEDFYIWSDAVKKFLIHWNFYDITKINDQKISDSENSILRKLIFESLGKHLQDYIFREASVINIYKKLKNYFLDIFSEGALNKIWSNITVYWHCYEFEKIRYVLTKMSLIEIYIRKLDNKDAVSNLYINEKIRGTLDPLLSKEFNEILNKDENSFNIIMNLEPEEFVDKIISTIKKYGTQPAALYYVKSIWYSPFHYGKRDLNGLYNSQYHCTH
ncbi:Tkp4 protein [Vanderwaltozyma polyspora DSM 70294]|uniref:Tkp4 protein n=1 Tax=Vanderwaltozyma polyspora (strain ATCC 22028 / DSM 70294 / BCRC 21397 / CBS 2163 / NBRC 10782 / NRRL Y-8283 / UCD 57-17) TaxID=436907 RepID=A7TDY2_VANPO|nr:Tkp4 protein [Vanderwaltozyma polyspora DSM 70294]EDO19602.1 Tkp4 protein [Vanderwaltozyma polyspora DSM 70294]